MDAAGKDTGRVEAFSDGVYAIAITLLVLDLKVPPASADLAAFLRSQWPTYAAFLTSFLVLGIMWLNHHRLFRLIRRVDHGLLLWNGALLLVTVTVPFGTSLLSEHLRHPGGHLAAEIYSGLMLACAGCYSGLWLHLSSRRRKERLLVASCGHPEVRAIHRAYLVGLGLYGAAFLLAFVNPLLALLVQAGLAVYFALPPQSLELPVA